MKKAVLSAFFKGGNKMIRLSMEGKLQKVEDKEQFSELLAYLCAERKLKMEDFDTRVEIEVCPGGNVLCIYKEESVYIKTDSTLLGPGYHAFIAKLYDDILLESGIFFDVFDTTSYYEERSFEDLKYKHFYGWLDKVLNGSEVECLYLQNILFSSYAYIPEHKDGFIITPMGYLPLKKRKYDEIVDLVEQFFLWNEEERDAIYYRNCSLWILWRECYFAYSNMNEHTTKTAETIIDYVEIAHAKDEHLALPYKEYIQLCNILQRETLILRCQDMYCEIIGYRQGMVNYTFGNWRIRAHGCSEVMINEKEDTLYIIDPYQDMHTPWKRMLRIQKVDDKTSNISSYATDTNAIEVLHNKAEECSGKAIILDAGEYQEIMAELVHEEDFIFLHYTVCDSSLIQDCLHTIRHIAYEEKLASTIRN